MNTTITTHPRSVSNPSYYQLLYYPQVSSRWSDVAISIRGAIYENQPAKHHHVSLVGVLVIGPDHRCAISHASNSNITQEVSCHPWTNFLTSCPVSNDRWRSSSPVSLSLDGFLNSKNLRLKETCKVPIHINKSESFGFFDVNHAIKVLSLFEFHPSRI